MQFKTLTLVLCLTSLSHATLVLNPALPIAYKLTVNPIIARDDSGQNPANFLGNAASEAAIKSFVDQIWEQAGIDVEWLTPKFLDSTEVLNGSALGAGNNPRPTDDLSNDAMGFDHETIGAAVREPNTVNMFFVDIAAGFSALDPNFVAGLAETPGEDISMFVGSDLFNSTSGQEVAASVIAHEIGHNLSLPHLNQNELLMGESGNGLANGERLTTNEINAAITSGTANGLLVAVPEPNAFAFVGFLAIISVTGTRLFNYRTSHQNNQV